MQGNPPPPKKKTKTKTLLISPGGEISISILKCDVRKQKIGQYLQLSPFWHVRDTSDLFFMHDHHSDLV